MPQTISPWDILTSGGKYEDREKDPECTTEVRINVADLAERVSKLLDHLGIRTTITSGFRTSAANKASNGAKVSAHCEGKAVDLEDQDGSLKRAILHDAGLLGRCDLYMEHPDSTPTWCHLSTRSPPSGSRIFRP